MADETPRYETTAQRLQRKIETAVKARMELQTRLDRVEGAIAAFQQEMADHQSAAVVFAESERERVKAQEKEAREQHPHAPYSPEAQEKDRRAEKQQPDLQRKYAEMADHLRSRIRRLGLTDQEMQYILEGGEAPAGSKGQEAEPCEEE